MAGTETQAPRTAAGDVDAVTATTTSAVTSTGLPKARSQWRRAWEKYCGNKLAVVSLVICALLVLAAIFAPIVAPYGYSTTDYNNVLAPTFSHGHLFGTDQLGRDLLSRLIFSLRSALIVALASQVVAIVLSVAIGLVAGYLGGLADQLLMGITDVMFAFPAYLFTIILVTVMGQSLLAVGLAIGIASWVTMARLVRGEVLAIKVKEYVEAGRAMGARGTTIATRYILPNTLGPILVTISFGIPAAITAEAGLSLIGLGVAPPTPSWGNLINTGRPYILSQPHMLVAPTVLFAITVLAFSWVGDGLRDAFDLAEEV
jgi:peptide/nickel transport system permease protein